MSSAFNPFPTGAQAVGPPPRKSVEYATGIVVSSGGDIVTDRQAIEGCQSIVVAGHGNADQIAIDKARDLALLRIYGAHGLTALALGSTKASGDVELTGIADPQNQGGGAAISSVKAGVTPSGNNGELALSPHPASDSPAPRRSMPAANSPAWRNSSRPWWPDRRAQRPPHRPCWSARIRCVIFSKPTTSLRTGRRLVRKHRSCA